MSLPRHVVTAQCFLVQYIFLYVSVYIFLYVSLCIFFSVLSGEPRPTGRSRVSECLGPLPPPAGATERHLTPQFAAISG